MGTQEDAGLGEAQSTHVGFGPQGHMKLWTEKSGQDTPFGLLSQERDKAIAERGGTHRVTWELESDHSSNNC